MFVLNCLVGCKNNINLLGKVCRTDTTLFVVFEAGDLAWIRMSKDYLVSATTNGNRRPTMLIGSPKRKVLQRGSKCIWLRPRGSKGRTIWGNYDKRCRNYLPVCVVATRTNVLYIGIIV
jgi:hypothetical protein